MIFISLFIFDFCITFSHYFHRQNSDSFAENMAEGENIENMAEDENIKEQVGKKPVVIAHVGSKF